MSRRPPNPAAERAAQNQQTIKNLLKLEANKVCADCKRNKHPRWASWNLGVFICIRCSGIHRGMGTHISRVKSVDLDAWTDEQLQSILNWGNARANKYWESKLAPGHIPSEAKIENFIRTKYELKRWVMDGPMPDPATLDADGDDDVPLSVVKEKQNVDRRESMRKASIGQSAAPQPDLIGADPVPAAAPSPVPVPPRASTAGPAAMQSIGSPSGWGSMSSSAVPSKPAPAPASSALGDLFDLSASSPPAAAAPLPALAKPTTTTTTSVFNLSANQPKPSPAPSTTASSNPLGSLGSLGASNLSNSDVWGGNAWAAPEAPKAAPEPPKAATTSAANDLGWASLASKPIVPGPSGGFAPKVAADEEFGGWTSSTTAPSAGNGSTPAAGFGGSDDLFSNVWQ
ncbi:831d51ea-e761-43ef-a8e4-4daf168919ad [Thermothielavioides terrestris]|uniref:831d51ea-e761-43ef-a8e4-4daf168919ad n=1 Tax=Thermothielavioides terrestris TaxID=2587410 RepID=A0A3S4B6N9_9PEZI|nr:831d51ea-e761-43ef-a8e4-4daf168919ad [Thermothielavioides terrestris]